MTTHTVAHTHSHTSARVGSAPRECGRMVQDLQIEQESLMPQETVEPSIYTSVEPESPSVR